MIIIEVIKPGFRIDIPDREQEFKLGALVDNLISAFFECNLALNIFNDEMAYQHKKIQAGMQDIRSSFLLRMEESRTIRSVVEGEFKKYGLDIYEYIEQITNETNIRINRMAWERGEIPMEFTRHKLFMYAKLFLFALDSFDKFLLVLSKEKSAPNSLSSIHGKISEFFPSLREVRNTAHHLEDRSRGLKRVDRNGNNHPLELKAVSNNLVHAEQGALVLNCLRGTYYGCTMSNGEYGEIDVSVDSLKKLHSILTEVIAAFSWAGPVDVFPKREN